MKIQVKDIEFNPFRNMTLVPINRDTIDKLKVSIQDEGVWVGMTARPKNNDWKSGKYEIPYGHHRLVVIRELGIKEIDIPIEVIPDFRMVLKMVRENMSQTGLTTEMINGTVQEVKEFLDNEIRNKTWEIFSSEDSFRTKLDIKSEPAFRKIKGSGVGRSTIKIFLKGSISEWKIEEALNTINSDDIDTEATNILGSVSRASGFKSAIRKINKIKRDKGESEIPISKQKDLADKVKDLKIVGKGKGNSYQKLMEEALWEEVGDEDSRYEIKYSNIMFELEKINSDSQSLYNRIISTNTELQLLGIESIKDSFPITNTVLNFGNLFSSVATMFNYFDINFKDEVNKIKNQ